MNFKNYTLNSNKGSAATTKKNDEVNTVAVEEREFSLLDLSYSHKTTFDAGKVVPIFQLEAYPGDTFTIDVNTLIKMSIPSAPTMDAPRYDINFFFVPWKQVFPNFNELIGTSYSGGSPEPAESLPGLNFSTSNSYGVNDSATHMELPCNVDFSKIGFQIQPLPFRAYVKIWDEWYRDENLIPEADYTNSNNINQGTDIDWTLGSNGYNDVQYGKGLLPACRLRDYFSSCLPFIQKGTIPSVSTLAQSDIQAMFNNTYLNSIPIENGGNSYFNPEITDSNGNALYSSSVNDNWFLNVGNNETNLQASNFGTQSFNNTNNAYLNLETESGQLGNYATYSGSGAGSFNITDLRTAIVKQHQNELDARAGTRYYEKLLSYWGVKVNPLEIGRTEYLGGWHDLININNVVQSAPQNSTATTPLGTLAGLSVTTGKLPNTINYSCSQYGIIIGLICVRTNISYSQGLPRLFTKMKNFDFYNPTFNGISEQPIYKYELYLDENGSTNNTQIFGYNQPWADLKYKPNVCSGYLSANATDTYYQFYTYQNSLSSSPTLTNTWIQYPASALENTLLLNASNQVENINDFLADFYYSVKVSRAIPAYSVPGVDKI